ncbi:MAG TPA: hypothetical protein VN861_17315 [Candidatus Acidoferrales bacterium]|nr:hypothetical protein [Candidatus Acidoferrales bacterium]
MIRKVSRLVLGLVVLIALVVPGVLAQSGQTISLTVDASQAPLKIIRSHIVMPVKPGPLTLYYPKWIPGNHSPDGPIASLTGLKFSASGRTIPWQRDLLDVFTFHVDVPNGADHLDISFDYIEGGASGTDKLFILEWNSNVLYPARTPSDQLTYDAKLVLPDGWKFGTSLPVANQSGNQVSFKPISLELLVDSPVITGEYYRVIDITPPGEPIHHEIDMVADSAVALNMSPEVQQGMVNLVAESGKLFGARHYRDYHFLFALSDHVAHFGLEHHESNDSRLGERTNESRCREWPRLHPGSPGRRSQCRQRRSNSDRSAGDRGRLLQNLHDRLSRRKALASSGTRRKQAGLSRRSNQGSRYEIECSP